MLEARDRVGGRTLNRSIGAGHISEIGGQFVGPTQDRILALARAVGIKTFPTYDSGSNVLVAGGARSLYPAVPGLPDDPDVQQAILAVAQARRPGQAGRGGARRGRRPRRANWDR